MTSASDALYLVPSENEPQLLYEVDPTVGLCTLWFKKEDNANWHVYVLSAQHISEALNLSLNI